MVLCCLYLLIVHIIWLYNKNSSDCTYISTAQIFDCFVHSLLLTFSFTNRKFRFALFFFKSHFLPTLAVAVKAYIVAVTSSFNCSGSVKKTYDHHIIQMSRCVFLCFLTFQLTFSQCLFVFSLYLKAVCDFICCDTHVITCLL